MSFGFSPSDVIKLLEISTRVFVAFRDANENSEAQVEELVREFAAFHHCLEELGELMQGYGKPLPFPCSDFHVTLSKCEKTLEPYVERLVDKKMGFRKAIYTIRYIGKEKEIDGLRKQISGHYQTLHLCISFLQLRLHLEATKQTQRLLDTAPFRSMSVDSRAYVTDSLGITAPHNPLALPAPDEHPLHSEWKIFDRWLQSEDSRAAQEEALLQRTSSDNVTPSALSGNAETAAMLYQLRQQVDDAILVEENRAIRAAGEHHSHLTPSDAMKQRIRDMPPAPPRTYTLSTEHSGHFSGFDASRMRMSMSGSAATIRPTSHSPSTSPLPSPSGSPQLEPAMFGAIDWAQSPSIPMSPHQNSNRSSMSTTRSSFSASPESRLSPLPSTAGTTPEGALSRLGRPLSATSLATIVLGEGALEWNRLCHKVQVERQSSEHKHGQEQVITETRECDVHWRYREDTGISLRSLYRSSRDGKPRSWTMQHFPATGPPIPLTTTFPDGEVSIDFPRGSFGRLDRSLTDIKYTFTGHDSAEKFQTLLYTNNGATTAELKFDRPVRSISSDKHATECRNRNLRLWCRKETFLDADSPVMCDMLVILFFTSALEEKGHWVEEPHFAFEWLDDAVYKKESDKVTLYLSKEPARWAPDKFFSRRKSSKGSVGYEPPRSPNFPRRRRRKSSVEMPSLIQSGTAEPSRLSAVPTAPSGNPYEARQSGTWSRTRTLNRFGYSELEVKFLRKEDRRAFLDVWRQHVKPFGATASGT